MIWKKIFITLIAVFIINPVVAKKLINDTEIEHYLGELITPLANAADIPDNRLKIYIIGENEFNAFVRGGEDVYVYTGLITDVVSPSALQAVIAHELAHTVGGHLIHMSARMEAEFARTMAIQALGIGLVAIGGDASLGMGVLAGSSGVAKQSMLSFSRDEERMADEIGLNLMADAKLNPNGFIQIFEQMQDLSAGFESKINPNNVKHPLTAERLQNVSMQIDEMEYRYNPDVQLEKSNTERLKMIQAKLTGYLKNQSVVLAKYPLIDNSVPANYARTISAMQNKDLSDAKKGVEQLIKTEPENPYFYELRGDIEYRLGDYDSSIKSYEKSLDLIKFAAPQIETAYALVLSARNQGDDVSRAITLCKKALLTSKNALTYWVLAKLYDTDGRADWARAEYYNLQGKEEQATRYAKAARKKLPKDSPEYIKSGDLLE